MELVFKDRLVPSFGAKRGEKTRPSFRASKTVPQTFVCSLVIASKRTTVLGCEDGKLVSWRPLKDYREDLTEESVQAHHGRITSLAYAAEAASHGLLFTASADRRIKVWDLWSQEQRGSVQVLEGHSSTVTGIQYSKRKLFSASNDGTVRIWLPVPGRRLLMYPWYTLVQTLRGDGPWISALGVRIGERVSVYAGDGDGNLLVFSNAGVDDGEGGETRPENGIDDGASADEQLTARGTPRSRVTSLQISASPRTARRRNSTRRGMDQRPIQSARTASTSREAGQHVERYGSMEPELSELRLTRRQKKAHLLGITTILVVPTQQIMICTSFDGALRAYDAAYGGVIFGVENPRRKKFTTVLFEPQEQEVYAGDEAGVLDVWHLHSKKHLKSVQADSTPLCGLAFLHSRTTLAVTSATQITYWHVDRDLAFTEIEGHTDSVLAMVLVTRAPTMDLIDAANEAQLVGSANPALAQLAAETQARHRGEDGGEEKDGRKTATRVNVTRAPLLGGTGAARVEDDEERLLTASLDGTVRFWDPYDMRELYSMSEDTSEVSCMLYMEDAGLVVTGMDDGSVRWWNPESGSIISLKRHSNTVTALCLATHKGLDFLISTGFDGTVILWDVTRRRALQPRLEVQFPAHPDPEPEILAVAFLPAHGEDGGDMADDFTAGGLSARLTVEDGGGLLSGRRTREPVAEMGEEKSRACFVTGGNDRVLRVWAIGSAQAEPLAELHGHEDSIGVLVVDGVLLFSGCDDGSVHVWNLTVPTSGYRVAKVDAHTGCIHALLLVPSIGTLVSAGADDRIVLWDASSMGGDDPTSVAAFTHSTDVRCLAYRPTTRALLAGTATGKIVAFRIEQETVETLQRGPVEDGHDDDLFAKLAGDGVDIDALLGKTDDP